MPLLVVGLAVEGEKTKEDGGPVLRIGCSSSLELGLGQCRSMDRPPVQRTGSPNLLLLLVVVPNLPRTKSTNAVVFRAGPASHGRGAAERGDPPVEADGALWRVREEVPAAAASSSAAEQHRGEGTSRGSSSGPSAVARVLMDSLQDDGHGDHDDSSTADGCYEDVESALGDGYGDDDADDRSAEASVRRLGGELG